MADESASLEIIEDFLAQKRIAIAGISRDSASDSVKLFEELCRRGYDVVPVNPNGGGAGAAMLRSSAGHPASRRSSVSDDFPGSH